MALAMTSENSRAAEASGVDKRLRMSVISVSVHSALRHALTMASSVASGYPGGVSLTAAAGAYVDAL